jgi:heme/copper-type cytochrome/quinol oxidase subunit 3
MNTIAREARTLPRPLPVGQAGRRTPGWWGMLCLIGTEAAIFAYLIFSYFYLQSQTSQPWPPTGLPPLKFSAPGTAILLLSVATAWWADSRLRLGRIVMACVGLAITALIGVVYVILQCLDWRAEPFLANSGAHASLYYAITAFHVLHAATGVLMLAAVILWTLLGHITAERHNAVTNVAMYWYFVVATWVAVFITLYLLPWITPH